MPALSLLAEGRGLARPAGKRVTQSSRSVDQPDHVRDDYIAGHEAKARPSTREERLAVAKYDGVNVEPILIDQAKIGQAVRQAGSGDFDLPGVLGLQCPYHRLDVIGDKGGVRTD